MTTRKREEEAIRDWWKYWIGNSRSGEARALSARLRRANTAIEALSEQRVFDLSESTGERDPHRLASLAMVLAHVETDVGNSLPRMLGAGEPRAMSDQRFQRLIRATNPLDLAVALRRALPLVGHACNVATLGSDILHWNENTRIRWCFHYFGAAAPTTTNQVAPASEEEVTT